MRIRNKILGFLLLDKLYKFIQSIQQTIANIVSELKSISSKIISIDVKVGNILNVPNVMMYVRNEQMYREQITYLTGILTKEQVDMANEELNKIHTNRRNKELKNR